MLLGNLIFPGFYLVNGGVIKDLLNQKCSVISHAELESGNRIRILDMCTPYTIHLIWYTCGLFIPANWNFIRANWNAHRVADQVSPVTNIATQKPWNETLQNFTFVYSKEKPLFIRCKTSLRLPDNSCHRLKSEIYFAPKSGPCTISPEYETYSISKPR